MMRIRIQAIPLAIALLSSILFMGSSINLAKANPYGEQLEYKALPVITINSPINNSTLFRDNVSLSITVTKPSGWLIYWGNARQMLKSISYQLDGKIFGPFMANSYLESAFNYSVDLPNLEIGVHSLKVHADATGWLIEMHSLWQNEVPITATSDTIYFTVEHNLPKVEIMPIKNSTTSDVPLYISVNDSTSKITYSLDGQENVTVIGNTTLTGLSNGLHNITAYAWDLAGNVGSSETIIFTVAEPFSVVQIGAASAAVVALTSVGVLVYIRRRKRQVVAVS